MVFKLKPKLPPRRISQCCSIRCSSAFASHSSAALPAPDVLRARKHLPAPLPSNSQLILDRELFYGHLILRAILASASSSSTMSFSPTPRHSNSNPPPELEPEHGQPDSLTDHEWELRTGRAIDILQQTLPDFFEIGLVSSLDTSPADPSSSPTNKSAWSLPAGTWHTIKDKLTSKSLTNKDEQTTDVPSIYSPRIRLTYTPPTPLPAPFPKTLHVEGLHLYIASSIFVRHTLNALYTDLKVELKRVRVNQNCSSRKMGTTAVLSPLQQSGLSSEPSSKILREKSIAFGIGVTGVGRVSGVPTEWQVNCRYTFSPLSGLIIHHSVDSIEPAPHQALFEALGKFGLLEGGVGGIGRPGGVGQ